MKKLIPAICMTLIAAVMLASSTFAWFSMNTQVTATGMQVVAKSDNTYLLISSDYDTADAIQGENKTTTALTVSDAEAKVYPCAPVTNSTETSKLSGTAIVTGANASTVGNWYTASAGASDKADIDWNTAKVLTTFTGYVIQKTVYLTVAKGANAAKGLTVTPTISQKGSGADISAARILITTSNGGFAILKNGDSNVDIHGSTSNNITDASVFTVSIYIYIDGNDSTIYTNNAANLTGVTIDLAFNVKAVTA